MIGGEGIEDHDEHGYRRKVRSARGGGNLERVRQRSQLSRHRRGTSCRTARYRTLQRGTHTVSAPIRAAVEGECRPGMGVVFSELSSAALLALTRYARRVPPLYMEW